MDATVPWEAMGQRQYATAVGDVYHAPSPVVQAKVGPADPLDASQRPASNPDEAAWPVTDAQLPALAAKLVACHRRAGAVTHVGEPVSRGVPVAATAPPRLRPEAPSN